MVSALILLGGAFEAMDGISRATYYIFLFCAHDWVGQGKAGSLEQTNDILFLIWGCACLTDAVRVSYVAYVALRRIAVGSLTTSDCAWGLPERSVALPNM